MNVSNAMPPVAGSAVNTAVPGAAQAQPPGGGWDELFASLLASLQVAPVSAAQSVDAVPADSLPDAWCQACPEDGASTEDADDGDVNPVAADNGESVASWIAASGQPVTQPAVTSGSPPAPILVAPESALPAGKPADPPRADATSIVAQAASTSAGESAAEESQAKGLPDGDGEAAPAASTTQARSAPAGLGNGLGAVVVEAVREGRAQAAAAEVAPGRTIRQLVQDAVAMVREQTRSAAAAMEAPKTPDAPETIVAAPVVAKAVTETVPELRATPADASSKAVAQAAVQAIGVSGGDAASPDAVSSQSRDAARATLPQSVDVRDVGEFTVRSVRYLSGRTEETVTVRLVPRSLGELQIAVRASAEGLDVILTVAGHATRDRLEGQIVGLREMLAREGIDVNRVTVQAPPTFDLSGQMPSQHNHHSHNGQAPRLNAQAFREPETNPPEQQPAHAARPQHDGGLNMLA